MSEWEPATDAEVAMRDALRTDDQESYFRILAGVDLLLPVSADALAGLAPLGWGTWSTGGRTHVLAFTSPSALQACLADYTGSARRVAYGELADTWPNLEWWLAVNPGLPIEGYLPAWFVAQLSRGDLRLPTRGPARDPNQPSKIQGLQAKAAAASPFPGGAGGPTGPGGPVDYPAAAAYPGALAAQAQDAAADQHGGYESRPSGYAQAAGYGTSPAQAASTSDPGGYGQQQTSGEPASGPSGSGFAQGPGPGQVGPGGLPIRTPGAVLPSGLPSRIPAGSQQQSGGSPGAPPGAPAAYRSPSGGSSSPEVPAAYRPPNVPVSPPSGPGDAQPGSPDPGSGGGPAGFGTSSPAASGIQGPRPSTAGAGPDLPRGSAAPGAFGSASGVSSDVPGPASGGGPRVPGAAAAFGARAAVSAAGAGSATGASSTTSASSAAGDSGSATGEAPGGLGMSSFGVSRPGVSGPGVAAPSGPGLSGPGVSGPGATAPGVNAPGAPNPGISGAGVTGGSPGASAPSAAESGAPSPSQSNQPDLPPLPDPRAPLPARTPMAQTPPVPMHLTGGEAGSAAQPGQQPASSSVGSALPRRQVTPPAERPASMAAAAQALAGARSPQPIQPPAPEQPVAEPPWRGPAPPVIPGAGGSDRPARTPFVPGMFAGPAEQPPPPEQPAAAQPAPSVPDEDEFVPANAVEQDLYYAAGAASTDAFLSTLLLATVLVPVGPNSRPGSAPGESGFAFRTEELDGERYLIVFTSRDRLAEHFAEPTRTVGVRFLELIRNWPDPAWSFAVNPNTPVGAKYPGSQVIALANWAAESGLGAEPAESPAVAEAAQAPAATPQRATDSAQHATVMQKTVPVDQVDYYLERGYDRVAGFVHRASEVEHLRTPGELFGALGLIYDGSPYQVDAKEAFVLRWPAFRPSLYRIPYGGQSEQALRAMDGWVIERPPFRGNGFAPGEGRDVIAEFKVDSVRLPHGAQLWRIGADGSEHMIAVLDCDVPVWRKVGEN